MVKDPAILNAAYNDAKGVTAEFNLNMLRHLNRELGSDFDLRAFRHVAFFHQEESRIEMHLESRRRQLVHIPGAAPITFAAGERIHTENSYKFTMPMVESILRAAGFTHERTWSDARGWFTLHLARRS
jgi:uncharacterized SAM-dependent methyltransferase